MKYIKTYEEYKPKWKPKYKIGDYILVYTIKGQIYNDAMLIEDIDDYEETYWCKFVFDHYYETIFEDEIVKKLEDYEIEAMRYNL